MNACQWIVSHMVHEETTKQVNYQEMTVYLKPIFHCDAKYLASGVGVGQCPRRQNFALEIPTCWYILALPNAKIDANPKICVIPKPTPDASRWNIGGVGSKTQISCVGHVHFIFLV